MPRRKPAITGSIDKDQLYYDSNYNPESVSYIGPRVAENHEIVAIDTENMEDIQ